MQVTYFGSRVYNSLLPLMVNKLCTYSLTAPYTGKGGGHGWGFYIAKLIGAHTSTFDRPTCFFWNKNWRFKLLTSIVSKSTCNGRGYNHVIGSLDSQWTGSWNLWGRDFLSVHIQYRRLQQPARDCSLPFPSILRPTSKPPFFTESIKWINVYVRSRPRA